MTDVQPAPERDAIASAIREVVRDSFSARRQVVLLSYVGQSLNKRGINFKEILGDEGLAAFIRSSLSGEINLVSTPQDPKVLAAYPSEIDLSNEIDPFGQKMRAREASSTSDSTHPKRDLINKGVWLAFTHYLPEGSHRILKLSPNIRYEDLGSEQASTDGIPVPRDLIVGPSDLDKDERNEVIYNNIERWCGEHGISFQSIVVDRPTKVGKRTALELLLTSLREGDLAKISMPLDVVNHLRKTQI